MGYKDGAEDLRAFRRACESRKVTPVPSSPASERRSRKRGPSRIQPGTAKLSKGADGGRRLRAKDDALAAAILGVATGMYGNRRDAETARVGAMRWYDLNGYRVGLASPDGLNRCSHVC